MDACPFLGFLQHATDRPAEALASYEQAREIQERLAREQPEAPDFAHLLSGTLCNMAVIDLDKQQFDKARAKLMQAIELQRKALAIIPNDPNYWQLLVNHLESLIKAEEGLGHADLAALARRELDRLRDSGPKIVALDARLAAVLSGKKAPVDELERAQLAFRAYEKSFHASSAR